MRVLGVQIGRVAPLRVGDRVVASGIRKHAITGSVAVRSLGLDGDEQADPTVHGGRSKAVYAYPVEHYDFWREQKRALGLSDELPYGSFGENLTVSGVLEDELFVGDELRFRNCVLRVTEPRRPCFKFAAVFGHPQAARTMLDTGFSGFYLAVDVPGTIVAGEAFKLVRGPCQTRLQALFSRS